MKTYYLPLSSKYRLPANDYYESEKELNKQYSWVEDLAIKVVDAQTYLLSQIPAEFQSVLSYMAYEASHSGGEEEVLNTLRSLVFDLKPAIDKFEARIRAEKA